MCLYPPLTTENSRVIYAWEHPKVPVDEVVNDVLNAFHHPALRDDRIEIQRNMFDTVKKWLDEYPGGRQHLGRLLSSESVRTGKNHVLSGTKKKKKGRSSSQAHSHGTRGIDDGADDSADEDGGHGKVAGSLWGQVDTRRRDLPGGDAPWQPGPAPHIRPPSSSEPFQGTPQHDFGYGGYSQPPPPGQYSGYAPPADPQYGGGYGGYQQSPPPPPPWGAPPPHPPPGGYDAPPYPAQDYSQQQYPPQGGYAPPQYPPQGQYQPPQGPPPPGWGGQYPGSGYGPGGY